MSRFLEAAALAALVALPAQESALANELGLGREATEAEIAAWDIDVRPDGQGLPEGSGTVLEGEEIYAEQCAVCHGDFGEGRDRWPVLAGGFDTLTKQRPVKTIGSYWPFASTVYDYVHRAMPFGAAQSLTADETYALTAYLLYLNYVVEDEDFELNRKNLTEMRLPNEGNFVDDPRPDIPLVSEASAPCMENCKDNVEVTMRAAVLDVTPEEGENPSGSVVSEEGAVEAATSSAQEPGQAEETESAPDPALVEAGEKVFRKCKACHMVGEGAMNRLGPHLNGVMGREAGAVEGFSYSDALAEKDVVWTAETLEAFLADPKEFAPGTKMSFRGLDAPEDRAAIVAYLERFSD